MHIHKDCSDCRSQYAFSAPDGFSGYLGSGFLVTSFLFYVVVQQPMYQKNVSLKVVLAMSIMISVIAAVAHLRNIIGHWAIVGLDKNNRVHIHKASLRTTTNMLRACVKHPHCESETMRVYAAFRCSGWFSRGRIHPIYDEIHAELPIQLIVTGNGPLQWALHVPEVTRALTLPPKAALQVALMYRSVAALVAAITDLPERQAATREGSLPT